MSFGGAKMKYTITVTFVIVIVLMGLYLVFGQNGLMKYGEMAAIRKNYEEKIAEMDKRLEAMRQELELAKKDKEYLENIIRRDLGMQKNGEDLYIIEDNNTTNTEK